MKINLVSDLHLEFLTHRECEYLTRQIAAVHADVLILAGDICPFRMMHRYQNFLSDLIEHGSYQKIFFIAGNHEYYHGDLQTHTKEYIDKNLFEYSNVHFLDRTSIEFENVLFLGATLWTNYNNNNSDDKRRFNLFMNDSGCIKNGGKLTDAETFYALHKIDTAFLLEQSIDVDSRLKKIVITHHGPTLNSIHPKYSQSDMNYSFSSDLEYIVRKINPAIWVHGHTHENIHYMIDEIQVHCNPRGYPNENAKFKTEYIINI